MIRKLFGLAIVVLILAVCYADDFESPLSVAESQAGTK